MFGYRFAGSVLLHLVLIHSATANERLNVLFIAADDLRAELGCLGDDHVLSPNIDELASRGTLFTRAYCQQSVCNPSRASLLTGLRPDTLRVWDLPTHFRQHHPNIVTLPQHFMAHGYYTENIGKIFHNWRQDDYKGDAPSWSIPAQLHYARHGDDKVTVKGVIPPDVNDVPLCEERDVPDDAYFDGQVASRAVDALHRLKDSSKPFFLAVGFWKPHSHFNAPKKYWDLYDRSKIPLPANPKPPVDVPQVALHDGREIRRAFKERPNSRPRPDEAIALRHGYYAATSYVDAQIGKLMTTLDELELAENTVIVFWSDHGFHLGEHSLWAKTSTFELDARVPLIIVAPQQPAGVNNTPVELLDLYPTLAELCNLPQPPHVEGQSLAPLVRAPGTSLDRAAYTQHPRPAYYRGDAPETMGVSVRTHRYRYTEWRDFRTGELTASELYDHDADPHETINRVQDDALSPAVVEAKQRLADVFPQ